ncbi:MAG: hypothetical protein ACXVNM_01150 [Bacteroidia bacterium]
MENIYDVIITYDISTSGDSKVYSAIKDAMIAKGYADRLTHAGTGEIIYLPNTTLWKKGREAKDAISDLNGCIDKYNSHNKTTHTIERGIATRFTSYYWALYGQAHKSSSTAPIKN